MGFRCARGGREEMVGEAVVGREKTVCRGAKFVFLLVRRLRGRAVLEDQTWWVNAI